MWFDSLGAAVKSYRSLDQSFSSLFSPCEPYCWMIRVSEQGTLLFSLPSAFFFFSLSPHFSLSLDYYFLSSICNVLMFSARLYLLIDWRCWASVEILFVSVNINCPLKQRSFPGVSFQVHSTFSNLCSATTFIPAA